MGDLSPDFDVKEFECKCGCGFRTINSMLLYRLQAVRYDIGRAVIISSGCRCEAHNTAEGGGTTSAHLTGEAVDIECSTPGERFELVSALLRLGFTRVGVKKDCIHADVSETLDRDVLWLY